MNIARTCKTLGTSKWFTFYSCGGLAIGTDHGATFNWINYRPILNHVAIKYTSGKSIDHELSKTN